MPTYIQTSSVLVAAAVLTSSGCAFDDLVSDENNVAVFATHHATPQDGSFPNRGRENFPRVFETDTGWTVSLGEAWLVTTGVTLVACNGQPAALDMWWGPMAEDMTLEDLDNRSIAGGLIPGGDYCSVVVEYGPFDGSGNAPEVPEVSGASLFLAGNAKRGDDTIPFTFRITEPLSVELDIASATQEGAPIVIEKGFYPKELTVSKTYDRFFDGVEFDSMDEQAVQNGLLTIAGRETRLALGDRPKIE